MNNIEQINDYWSYHIIDQLTKKKVTDFCIAPGSRSSPLTLAAAERKDINTLIHFDERGLSFYAIGVAKEKKKPVVIIVTSGTAVGNLLPALMEASQSNIPLILLTADRPLELKECGANQTIDQTKIFQNFVKWQCELIPSSDVNANYIRSVISYSVFKSLENSKGPIHINCRFKEPLYPIYLSKQRSPIANLHYTSLNNSLNSIDTNSVLRKISFHKKGLILVCDTDLESIDDIIFISEQLNWPVYIEILSRKNVSMKSKTFLFQLPYLLDLHSEKFNDFECLIQFGGRIISKSILKWIKNSQIKTYFLISEHNKKTDELHLVTDRIITPLKPFVTQFKQIKEKRENNWIDEIKSLDLEINSKIFKMIHEWESLSEHHLYTLLNTLENENLCIFFGNSSVIRDANSLFFPHMKKCKTYANRGVSGIDGNIATVAGIASAIKTPIVAVIGDLTFLHDLTSIYFLKSSKNPVILFVINNNGGEIFSQLQAANFKVHFEKFFKTPHNLSFSKIAEFFSIKYKKINSILDFGNYMKGCCFQESKIVELNINSQNCLSLRSKIKKFLKESACSHLKKEEIQKNSH